MKNITTLLAMLAISLCSQAQSVAINADGSSPDTSAILDIKSTTKGLLIPRLTGAQRSAIVTPATGLMVFQTDGKPGYYYFNGSSWLSVVDNSNNLWFASGTNIYEKAPKVGIGASKPLMTLHVASANGLAMIIENPSTLATDVTSGMYFKTKNEYFGSIKAIGTGTNSGRLGLFTSSNADSSQLFERLTITDGGAIGINTLTPAAQLEVNGSTLVDGTLQATGSVYAGGNAYVTGTAVISGGAQVTGSLTNGGLGAVVGSNGTQLKVVVYNATLTVTNLAANTLLGATGTIAIPAGMFSGTPSAYIGDIIRSSENGDYYRVTIIPDNVSATSVSLKIFNGTSTTVSFSNVTWKVLVIGPK